MLIASLAERPDLLDALPFGAGWPRFIFHDPVASELMPTVERIFADLNLVLLDDAGDQVVAGGWGVPVVWDGTVDGLPAGWDGALQRAVDAHESGSRPTTLCAMATEVVETHRARGLSGHVLSALRRRASEKGLGTMIAPARPTLKQRYPLVPIARYAQWTREDGAPFDPWIRTHWRLGARILAPEQCAMRIVGTVAEWEEWTGVDFPESGDFVVPEALSVVSIDRERDRGTYIEPAVWMLHAGDTRPQAGTRTWKT
jgi:hypothetical protein